MKNRFFSILLCAAVLLVQMFACTAVVHAEGEIVVTAELDDTMLADIEGRPFAVPMGKFLLKYTITNNSFQPISDIVIREIRRDKNGDEKEKELVLGDIIQPGESRTYSGRLYDAELDASPYALSYDVSYYLMFDNTTERASGQKELSVIDTKMDIKYNRQSTLPVFKGEHVPLAIEVRSLANVTLYNIVVSDSVLGELGRIDALLPGTTYTIETDVVPERSTEGHVRLSYDDPMGIMINKLTQEFFNDGLKIEVKDEVPAPAMSLTAATESRLLPTESDVLLNLTLKNTGNTALTGIECLDWEGKVIYNADQLLPGEEAAFQYTGTIKPGTSYDIKARALPAGTGQPIETSYTIIMDKLNQSIEIERTFNPNPVIPGKPFIINYVIKNTGNVDLKDVVISEPAFGEIARFDLLEAGREVSCSSKEITINEKAVSETLLSAKDAELNSDYVYEAAELEIPMEATGEKQALSFLLKASESSINKPGTIELECIVKNTGMEPLYNLVFTLMDREMVIDNTAVLEPGEEKVIAITPFRIEKTETFYVQANGLGKDQSSFTASSKPLTVEVIEKAGGKSSILKTILIIIILLCIAIAGALIYLVVGTLQHRYRRKSKTAKTRSM